MTIDPGNFLNTRCTFQRVKDARIFHGWVESFDEHDIAIRTTLSEDMSDTDVFYFQVFGLEEDLTFGGLYCTKITTNALLADSAHPNTALCMFSVNTKIAHRPSNGNPRLTNQGAQVTVVTSVPGLRDTEPLEVLDISPRGLALALPTQLPKETELELRVATGFGEVQMKALVKNSRMIGDHYRHGLEIQDMHRIDQLRWNRMFKGEF